MLLDVFGADPRFGQRSRDALRDSLAAGSLVACEVVWAEVAAAFPNSAAAQDALERLNVAYAPLGTPAALAAGSAWSTYRRRGGKRERLIADFLIGAHAESVADRLLTRDRGFYGRYFEELKVLDPSAE